MSEVVQDSKDVPDGYDIVHLGPKSKLIPTDWDVKPLVNWLSSLETGGRPKTSERSDSDTVLSIGGAHISDGSFDLDDPVRISKEYYEGLNSGEIEEDDILLVKDGATIGKSTYVDNVPEGRAAVNSHVYILRVNKDAYDPRFLYYFINSRIGLDQTLRLTTGSAQAGLNRTFQQAVKVPTPPFSEQSRIADILSTVDEQIQQTDKIIEGTKDLREGLMQDLYSSGIGNNEFSTHQVGPREIEIPSHWKLRSVDELKSTTTSKKAIRGGPPGGRIKSSDRSKGGAKLYVQENVIHNDFERRGDYISPEKFKELQSAEVDPGDVLITRSGTIGKSEVFPDDAQRGILGSSLIRVKVDKEIIRPQYLSQFLADSHTAQSQIKSMSHGGTRTGLNNKIVKSIKVPVPPINEQDRISEILEHVDGEIQQEKQYQDNLEKLKQGLMQDLLTGKVRVGPDN